MISHDESLLTRIRKGERKAMEELYDTYAPVLLSVAQRYCTRREEAEDLLHESLLKILKGVHTFNPTFEGAFEAWMRRITVNQCLTYIKRKIDFLKIDSLPESGLIINSDEFDSGELPELNPTQVVTMIQSLPIGYRTVLNLYVFEHMTHKEIARELNISENTSKSQLSKARIYLKKQLELTKKTVEAAR
ncbi:MAG TPA: sigma-70 family RNA polymerase sigma factor [Lentimicrobium sp.]|nr:sigma-70 family RNA polymerase sigma factor [Lentimicrobium sp.]